MTQESEKLLTNLYNAFDPFYPLPAGDPQYVDCREVRGDGDITAFSAVMRYNSNS
ncbi:hypothetical protein [Microcoleus sp. Pol12B4]|uniref:hypothetical protein n=1 Tax=Microcoleus sp. Pol12B4 TaxID=3055395 RepID=UPI002FCF36DF